MEEEEEQAAEVVEEVAPVEPVEPVAEPAEEVVEEEEAPAEDPRTTSRWRCSWGRRRPLRQPCRASTRKR